MAPRAQPSPTRPPRTAVHNFEPTLAAARARLAAVDPDAYARTRNALDGAVTRLSPYLTHGLLSLRNVYETVHARHPLAPAHKFVFELGWRAYWRHVWAHRGDAIARSLHAGLLPEDCYQQTMPEDVLEARTGIPAIDLAVRELYTTGYLHNHARMWLASYLVHLRKVHWHTGAQWMLGHLLDGDVASNHLSWQWVAGTGSTKPYLFNADNVARYAPAAWNSPGTVIDTSYEALDRIARSPAAVVHRADGHAGISGVGAGMPQPGLWNAPPDGSWARPDHALANGRDVHLIHPWSIGAAPHVADADAVVIGVGLAECHARTPWSARRWDFVTQGLRAQTLHVWWGSPREVAHALGSARRVTWQPDPHADAALGRMQAHLRAGPAAPMAAPQSQAVLFVPVDRFCRSFSEWWKTTRIASAQPPANQR